MNTVQSKRLFLDWVKKTRPDIYARAMPRAAGLSGMGESYAEMIAIQDARGESAPAASVPWYEKALDMAIGVIGQIAPTIVAGRQATTLMKINIERAKLGQPPLDTTAFSPQFNVGIPKDIQYILWGAVAVGAIFVVAKLRK